MKNACFVIIKRCKDENYLAYMQQFKAFFINMNNSGLKINESKLWQKTNKGNQKDEVEESF